ncbi:MAG: hypothetical protein L0Z62_23900, partial [Gemmataceae bacterium]|nr:hypothetical protein [Gemmataceae bacterium]
MERVEPSFANYRLLFELLDREPTTDSAALASIVQFEARWNSRLPASLREWFSFSPNTIQGCFPPPLAKVASWQPQRDDMSRLPEKLCLGLHDGDEYYYVPLEGHDDPPVLLESPVDFLDLQIRRRFPEGRFATTFSDAVLFWGMRRAKSDYWARAEEVFHPAAWDDLHDRFQVAESVTSAKGGYLTLIARGGQIFLSWDRGDPRSEVVPARWVVSGLTERVFVALLQAVAPWVDLLRADESHCSPLAAA